MDPFSLVGVVFVVPDKPTLWDFAALPGKLPGGAYAVADDLDANTATLLALAWALAGYRFNRYKQDRSDDEAPQLVWPATCRRDEASYLAEPSATLARDLRCVTHVILQDTAVPAVLSDWSLSRPVVHRPAGRAQQKLN